MKRVLFMLAAVVILIALSLMITKAIWNSNLPDWLKIWFIVQHAR